MNKTQATVFAAMSLGVGMTVGIAICLWMVGDGPVAMAALAASAIYCAVATYFWRQGWK